VVVATGVEPRKPDIPGIDHPKVAGYVDVLSGRIEPGRDVVIIGMGGIGFDVALYLLERGHRSTLDTQAFSSHWGIAADGSVAGSPPPAKPAHRITMLKRSGTPFGHTLGRTTGWVHRAELARNGVKMLKGIEYRRIDDAGVHITSDGKELVIPADTVILCAGQEPLRSLKARHFIGGAKEAGELDAKRAMLEGAQLAASL
jgi:2,4-dienoyl-CoA reductase (NADPH2)